MSNYSKIELDKPFRIANKDLTAWRKGEYGLEIYFHTEDFWSNPPTETSITSRAIKQIEKHGIEMLPEDYVKEYNRIGRAEALEKALARHRENIQKNKHLYGWMKSPPQPNTPTKPPGSSASTSGEQTNG